MQFGPKWKRNGDGTWTESQDKAWLPGAQDVRYSWRAFEFCILLLDNGWNETPEVNLIRRTKGDSVWLSVGPNDGMVYEGSGFNSWPADVEKAGGFAQWWAPYQAEINRRLAEICALLSPSPPVVSIANSPGTTPATFNEYQTWMQETTVWSGDEIAPPGPTPSQPGDIFGPRWFLNGCGVDEGLRFKPDGSVSSIRRITIPGVGARPLPFE